MGAFKSYNHQTKESAWNHSTDQLANLEGESKNLRDRCKILDYGLGKASFLSENEDSDQSERDLLGLLIQLRTQQGRLDLKINKMVKEIEAL